MRGYSLLIFIAILCLIAIPGIHFEPGSWYAGLVKPPLTPPNWVFPVVWTILYLMIAIAGWLVWQHPPTLLKSRALLGYGIQLLLNASWSWIFFGRHWTTIGLINIVLLLPAIIVTIRLFLPLRILAAVLLVPYLGWVGFALYLNAGIVWLN